MNASRQARRIDPLGCAVPTITRISSERIRYLCAAGVNAQQTVSPGQTQYLHGDLIDSTMLTTDQWGTGSQPVISYTAFGEPIGDPDLLGTRYQYAGGWGYESDLLASDGAPDCGLPPIVLLHVGARWYDPSIGRFIQRDPIGAAGGANVYLAAPRKLVWDRDAASANGPSRAKRPRKPGALFSNDWSVSGPFPDGWEPASSPYGAPRPPPRPLPPRRRLTPAQEAERVYDMRTTFKVAVGTAGVLVGGPVAVGVTIGLACVEVYEAWTDDPEHGIR